MTPLSSSKFRWSVPVLTALLPGIGGLLVICGWVFRVPALRGAMLGSFVAPVTALLLVTASTSLLLQRNAKTRPVGVALGGGVALVAFIVMLEYLTGRDLGVDRLFLGSRLGDWTTPSPPGRIAAPTSVAFFAAGFGLAFLRSKITYIVDIAASIVFTVAYFAIIGYIYGAVPFYGYVMGLPTPFLLLMFCLALLSNSESLIRGVLISDNAGGVLLRRILPMVIFGLPFIGWLRLRSQNNSLLPPEIAAASFVLATVLIFTFTAIRTAHMLNQFDTERRQAQRALVRSEKLAATGRLAATIAHEINNPLSAALNALYLARTDPQSSSQYVLTAEEELLRVATVARRSLSFYRGESKRQELRARVLLEDVAELFRPLAKTRDIHLEVDCDVALHVIADAGELRQIFVNLLSNALDASNAKSKVVLGGRAAEGVIELSVLNHGEEIPEEVRERIFEPFYTTKPDVGTGLGLYVVKDLVQKNGGEIRLSSLNGITTFVVSLRGNATGSTSQSATQAS